ncbi:MAG: molecular chaperone HtpG [Alphaproteobacteria bacterium]
MAEDKSADNKTGQQAQTQEFQAEVGRLLDIVTHALYSEREIFLRELISNAADACDRLRYAALSQPDLMAKDQPLEISITSDADHNHLIIHDNGIGMGRDELIQNLGTIARSGTGEFMSKLSGDSKKDINLIGQFGVGFYSAFMVADHVTVISQKAGEEHAHEWESDGKSGFTIKAADADFKHGTKIILTLKADGAEFLENHRIKHIVTTYSNHISFPILLTVLASKQDQADDEEGVTDLPSKEQINRGAAPWTLAPSKLDDDAHKEFYHHVAHAHDDPWGRVHFHAEGTLEYSALLYVPSERPFDLFNPERLNKVKLYVKRVFITDNCESLLPSWLRFLRGVVDSQDLPLNVSREMLQNNAVLNKMRGNLVKKTLDMLKKRSESDQATYLNFWDKFGVVLKEGLCDFGEDKAPLLELARFHSTKTGADGWQSLNDYKAGMKENQDIIYYISGEDPKTLLSSPHLEGFKAKGVEVLLFTDPVDEFWVGYMPEYQGLKLQSVTRAGADLDKIGDDAADDSADDQAQDGKKGAKQKKGKAKKNDLSDKDKSALLEFVKETLKDHVSGVELSTRLTESPVCLVSSAAGPDLHLERLLKAHNQLQQETKRILELNPAHPLVAKINSLITGDDQDKGRDQAKEIAEMLHDQARIMDGEPPIDAAAFAKRLNQFMLGA